MELDNNAVWAIIGVHLIQWAKETSLLKQINEKTDLVNRLLNKLWAIATGLGITIATQGDILGGMTLTVSLPALTVLVKNLLINYGMQEAYYRKVIKKNANG